ncbi:unnamed protein product [Rotaria sordida]|uniref:Uncharacterized protein n=1 Tax=Rotaria sordida TaxID=392033 RepID=A0A814TH09_9BILA|nr:unnamed protein product [Rotaria sordida]
MCTVNLTNNQTTTLLSSSLLLLLSSTYDDSPLLDLLFNTTIKQKYEDKHSHVHEQINITLNSEIEQNINICNSYSIGMELREIE